MAKVIWTAFAMEDLKSIHEYVSRDSKYYATQLIDRLINRVDQLENFPRSGRVVPEFDNELIRELIEGTYRIVYRIQEDSIGIVRIHHSARILKNL